MGYPTVSSRYLYVQYVVLLVSVVASSAVLDNAFSGVEYCGASWNGICNGLMDPASSGKLVWLSKLCPYGEGNIQIRECW